MGRVEEIFGQLKDQRYFNDPELVPQPPEITEDKLKKCRETGDFRPVLFEWYKFVGRLCVFLAQLKRDSPAIREVEPQEYYVLVGLLNRCARLMLANVALSHEGVFGETTAILDRCIFESAVKIIWLVNTTDSERFRRLIADGLKTELEFKAKIEADIASRGGAALAIEKRMLASIQNSIASSGMSAQEIADAKKLPDLATMIETLWHDWMFYLIGQKIGSHHVHGTWVSLRLHYLEEKDGELAPRDHDCQTHVNQYLFTTVMVLAAMEAFMSYIIVEEEGEVNLLQIFDPIRQEINRINTEVLGEDFELAKDV